jgi:hypothetical protein
MFRDIINLTEVPLNKYTIGILVAHYGMSGSTVSAMLTAV